MSPKKALERAVELAGGQAEMARKLTAVVQRGDPKRSVKQQNVWGWLYRTKGVPPDMAIPIEEVVEGQVRRHELRPDLYPANESASNRVAAS